MDFYRTVDWIYLTNIYGVTKENVNLFIGRSFINKGYMSTSSEFKSPWANNWLKDEVVMHIHGDTEYINVNNVFSPNEIDCESQKELIIPRNTRLILTGVKRLNNREKTYFLEFSII